MTDAPDERAASAWRVTVGLLLCAVAGLGWWRHSVAFALLGVTGLLLAGAMRISQRHCLDRVTYRRSLSVNRARFGEEVRLETELVNDKILPLTWIEVEDEFPVGLSMSGVSLHDDPTSGRRFARYVSAMLPFQRIRRHVVVTADRRGRYVFGPGRLRSGDPLGHRTREEPVRERVELLVFPKVLALSPPGVVPEVLLGEQRVRGLLGDPSRVAGVRDYRPGDPLRYLDWRASARGTTLLVREHEPTASLRAAVFVDLSPYRQSAIESAEILEFTISIAASVLDALAGEGIGVGLYASGSAQRQPISHPPSTAPQGLGAMLELLAEASPYGALSFSEMLAAECARLSTMTSLVVIAPSFPERVLALLGARRRRSPVSTIWIKATEDVWPPLLDDTGYNFTATYHDDFSARESLELS